MANQTSLDARDIGNAMVAGESININVGTYVQLLRPSETTLRSVNSKPTVSGDSKALEVRQVLVFTYYQYYNAVISSVARGARGGLSPSHWPEKHAK